MKLLRIEMTNFETISLDISMDNQPENHGRFSKWFSGIICKCSCYLCPIMYNSPHLPQVVILLYKTRQVALAVCDWSDHTLHEGYHEACVITAGLTMMGGLHYLTTQSNHTTNYSKWGKPEELWWRSIAILQF